MAEPDQARHRTLQTKKYPKTIDDSNLDKIACISALARGMMITKYVRYGAPHERKFTVLEFNRNILSWKSQKKKHTQSRIEIDQIYRIELGQKSKKLLKRSNPELEDRTVALYYKNQLSLDLAFNSPEELRTFVAAIQFLQEEFQESMENIKLLESRNIGIVWGEADSNSDGTLNFEQVKRMVRDIGYKISDEEFAQLYTEMDSNLDKMIDKREFQMLMNKLFHKPELLSVFQLYKDLENISMKGFQKFMKNQQKTYLKKAELFSLIQEITHTEQTQESTCITFEDFCRFITSPVLNNAFDTKMSVEYQDMTLPLPLYYVESSHNTYLVGHQLRGESSIDMYARVLLSGCRCVELDVWDGPDLQPKVTHGHTLVSHVTLRDVCLSIQRSAFENSPYPIILSLQNHCSQPQQDRMAEILQEIFGVSLYVPVGESQFPSPEALKHRVLIKCKPASSDSLNGVIALQGTKDFLGDRKFNSIPSRSEAKMTSLVKDLKSSLIVDMHKFFFTRVYPGAKRFGSSNYNPVIFWLLGCQIVALNYQTNDLSMVIQREFFRNNGSTGYVLKPEMLRVPDSCFFMNNPDGETSLQLSVRVISAQSLPKLPAGSNFFVEVSVHGVPQDCVSERTSVVRGNRFNPIWDESFDFKISVGEVTLLVFEVCHKGLMSKVVIARYGLPVSCVREGYRVVPLYDCDMNMAVNSYLLCKFKKAI